MVSGIAWFIINTSGNNSVYGRVTSRIKLADKKNMAKNYNTLWGLEYIIMYEGRFISDNLEKIIEMMVKSREIKVMLQH